jgi:hypothetical protein
VTDLVLIYESVTSSASVVRWLTLHSWTLNSLTIESEWTHEWTLLQNSRRTDERPPQPTVRVLVCSIRCHGNVLTEPLWCKRVLIPGQRHDFYQRISCYGTRCLRAIVQQWTSASDRCYGNACLASHWLAMGVYSDFTIPAFRRLISIFTININFLSFCFCGQSIIDPILFKSDSYVFMISHGLLFPVTLIAFFFNKRSWISAS